MKRILTISGLWLVAFAILFFAATPALADWFPTNPTDLANAKWIQSPDLSPYIDDPDWPATGMDVLDTRLPGQQLPANIFKILADDFQCTRSGPITDIHIWGSWLSDRLPQGGPTAPGGPGSVVFKLSFHADVQAGVDAPYSHPGAELWHTVVGPGQFNVIPWGVGQEQFYDPNRDTHNAEGFDGVIGTDTEVWQYNFKNLGPNPFVQTEGTIYWLDVQALVLDDFTGEDAVFGWKTRDPRPPTPEHPGSGHFQDDAVFADTDGFNGPLLPNPNNPNNLPWRDMRYPLSHPLHDLSFDMAFVLTTPEPGTITLGGLGLISLVVVAYRRRLAAGSNSVC